MHIVSYKKIKEFFTDNADAEQPLETWFAVVENATWTNFNEVMKTYPTADYVGANRVVFNIKGNRYRLVARILFTYKQIQIRWIGTHAEYDKIDVLKV